MLNDSSYTWASGTSMAAPHVAGLAAVYLGLHPSAPPSEVKSQILKGASSGSINFAAEGGANILPGTPNLVINTLASVGLSTVSASEGP